MLKSIVLCAMCVCLAGMAGLLQTQAVDKPAAPVKGSAQPAALFADYEEIILAKRNRGAMVPGSIVIAPGRDKWGIAMQQFIYERGQCAISRESATYVADLFVEFLLRERETTWMHAPAPVEGGEWVWVRSE